MKKNDSFFFVRLFLAFYLHISKILLSFAENKHIRVMKTRTFTTKIYRCSLEPCGGIVALLLESKDITVSDMSISVQQVNSFMRTYFRDALKRGRYLVQTSCNRGRVLYSVYVEF